MTESKSKRPRRKRLPRPFVTMFHPAAIKRPAAWSLQSEDLPREEPRSDWQAAGIPDVHFPEE